VISRRHAQVQRLLMTLGSTGHPADRLFFAPDLRAGRALTAASASFLIPVLITLTNRNQTPTLLSLVTLLTVPIVLGFFLNGAERVMMGVTVVLLYALLFIIPGTGPLSALLALVTVFIGLRYLGRHRGGGALDTHLGRLAPALGHGWKAYLPRDPEAQRHVRVLVSPEDQTFYLGIVPGTPETRYGTPHVAWVGLTDDVLRSMADRDQGVVQSGQTVLWVTRPPQADGEYPVTLGQGVSTVIGTPQELAVQLSSWSTMKANLNDPTTGPSAHASPSEQGQRVEARAAEELLGQLPPGWVMRTSILLAEGGDADIELTTAQREKYVIDVKSRTDRMHLETPKGDRAKSWAEIHAQVVGAARQLRGVPVIWQPLTRDEDFALTGEVWCLRGPVRTLIEALTALEMGEPEAQASPHQVLGVQPGATREEIQAAYKRLAKQYHPDRVASLGEEFRQLAERRMKVINAAYQALME